MKVTLTTIVSYFCVVGTAFAQPADNSPIVDNVHGDDLFVPEPITLTFGKEYSLADLRKLSSQRDSATLQESLINNNEVATTETAEIAGESEQKRAVHQPRIFKSSMSMIYNSLCGGGRYANGNFTVTVTFDGIHAKYLGTQNIDKFYSTTMLGDPKKPRGPLHSTARYVHQVCKTPADGLICTYYHTGTIKADITRAGGEKGVDLDVGQKNDPDITLRPFVIETCVRVPHGGKSYCPPADMALPHCDSGKILTQTLTRIP